MSIFSEELKNQVAQDMGYKDYIELIIFPEINLEDITYKLFTERCSELWLKQNKNEISSR